MSQSYQFEDVVLVAKTQKAILIRYSDVEEGDAEDGVDQFWIPLSIIEGSDLDEVGDEGCVEVPGWFARKLELETE